MNGFLVDTNVISEFEKPQPDPHVVRWMQAAAQDSLFVSVVTFGELRLGIEDLPPSKRRNDLESWLENGLPACVRLTSASHHQEHRGALGRADDPRQTQWHDAHHADGLIAAPAVEHDLTLVTRNVKDFTGLGLTILNPWD